MGGKSIAHTLGKRIREERSRKGISQIKLSMGAGLSANYISDIERGTRDVKISTIERIAQVLGVPPGTLLM
ncbi:MAG: helix-turn-helix transcriptional regulator [Patescibacteria group bacterium]